MQEASRLHYFELFASALLAVTGANSSVFLFFVSRQAAAYCLAFYSLFLVYVFAYIIKRPKAAPKGKALPGGRDALYSVALHVLFVALVLTYVLAILSGGNSTTSVIIHTLLKLDSGGLFFLFYLPEFLLASLALYLAKVKHDYKSAFVLLCVVLMILILLYDARFYLKSYNLDDEELLSIQSFKSMLSGGNPYTYNVGNLLYENFSTIGLSVTTRNTVMGIMDYPALFFLSAVPFYLIATPTVANLEFLELPLQATVWMFILVVAIVAFTKKKDLLRPNLMLIVLFALAITNITSVRMFLMLALIVISYAIIDDPKYARYAWIPLGLSVSLHEELWIPVGFLLIYSLNRNGLKKTLYSALGAAVIFLLINGYFIAINPPAYVNAVFGPLNNQLMPISPSAFTFPLMAYYPILISTYAKLFEIVTLLLSLVLLYFNRKELIPIFSLVTLLALPHALAQYYTFFIFFMFFALLIEEEKVKGKRVFEKFLKERKYLFYAALLAIVALMAFVIYASHAEYVRNFSIGLENQSIAYDNVTKSTVYNADIVYHGLGNDTVYALGFVHYNFTIINYGLINQTMIVGEPAPTCGNYTCRVNTNRIVLPANQTSYHITADLMWSNGTDVVDTVGMELYNDNYFYVGKEVGLPPIK